MPYIDPFSRHSLDKIVDAMIDQGIKADGDLNYILFAYFKRGYSRLGSYNGIKNYIGELTECGEEIRRRFLSKHEDQKIEENGDV